MSSLKPEHLNSSVYKEMSLLGSAAHIGSQYATDGLLICPSSKFFVVQNWERERERAWIKWNKKELIGHGEMEGEKKPDKGVDRKCIGLFPTNTGEMKEWRVEIERQLTFQSDDVSLKCIPSTFAAFLEGAVKMP